MATTGVTVAVALMKEKIEYVLPDFRKDVRRGAALLDKKVPNWHRKIQMRSLDLSSGVHCVLGQVFVGSIAEKFHVEEFFSGGVEALFPGESEKVVEHGFDIDQEVWDWVEDHGNSHPLGDDAALTQIVWDRLGELWTAEISKRKDSDKAARAARRKERESAR